MRFDDSHAFFDDEEAVFDSGPAQSTKVMAKIKLGLSDKSLEEKATLATTFATKLTNHPVVTTPDPTPEELTAKVTIITNKKNSIAALQAQVDGELMDLEHLGKELDQMLTDEAVTIQKASGGDAAVILSTGAEVQAERVPTGAPGQVLNLVVRAGGNDGELEARFKRDERARSYEVQSTSNPNAPETWEHEGVVMRARMTIQDLESGKKRWVRVRALNSFGAGPWSDPGCAMVP
jgi:hypothetical protein